MLKDKLLVIREYHNLIKNELSKIDEDILKTNSKIRAEEIAYDFYIKKGYEVFKSKVEGGYRIIGVDFYWSESKNKLTKADIRILEKIKSVMNFSEFKKLAYLIKEKNGCPDLMSIKDDKIEFVEVKSNNEEVKTPTIEFFIKLNNKYKLRILRVVTKT